MHDITRRDFLNGLAWAGICGALAPLGALAASGPAADYPPALTGMRGAHPGAFETAHALAWGGKPDFGPVSGPVEQYDLIVIGAGISGLSAALYYRDLVKADARILILDNHDDFGGHAKRNEFSIDGRTCLSYGGTQSFDDPASYSKQAADLLRRVGINLTRLEDAYDLDFFSRHQLSSGIYYDPADFGRAALLRSGLPTSSPVAADIRGWVPGLQLPPSFASTLSQAPLSSAQRSKLQQVLSPGRAAMQYFQGDQGEQRLYGQSYLSFLRRVYGIEDKALLKLLSMTLAEEAALGGNGVSLALAQEGGLLGLPDGNWLAKQLEDDSLAPDDEREDDEGYVYHFPDGNASLARLLVQKLVPGVARFDTPEQCLTARFDYARLDRPDQPVRIRLSSMAVQADNQSGGTYVRYLQNGRLHEARARHTVMAGWHMMAAHIIPSLSPNQKAAMRANIKMPLVYAQVALRNWQPIARSGVAAAYCPGSYFQYVQMDFPVSMGAYQPRRAPDQPHVLLMARMPCPPFGEGSVADLLRQGRADLLATDFAQFEQQIRQQLTGMYGPHGFDANKQIAAITVNRWPHGYVYEDARYQGKPAHLLASKRHGNIVMANADAAGRAYTDAAIDMAWRAVQALKAGT
ncbi:NAD(P)/FAD-dependent oxidoreductase [Paludibacterium sp. THUN1379]|uniref:NAD(P)-binding protein n=1 Tax=Paludibacterium sp. THUN1379 TaxID=3112107 RepID=UPI00308E5F45|nr:NAD(P)/FAD-dependent oxidoreductase [Paludibacterium sp. THUN1379]